jgi:hypothetical protein
MRKKQVQKAPVVILEGSWWSNHEVPLVLPYFNALATSHQEIDLSHRTIRNVDDIAHYVSRIPEDAGAMLYFACHGAQLSLYPIDEESPISQGSLLEALKNAKTGAISFVHFGCCEMVETKKRRKTHQAILDACGAKWASGYTKEVNWLRSTFLDLALVSELFVPDYNTTDGRAKPLKKQADNFVRMYSQLARELGFSALSKVSAGELLFPERLGE